MNYFSPDRVAWKLARKFPLKGRLALGYIVAILAVLTIAIVLVTMAWTNSRQLDLLIRNNDALSGAVNLSNAVTIMQMDASRYISLGHDSAREEVESQFRLAVKELEHCRESTCADIVGLQRLNTFASRLHLFRKTFRSVAVEKETLEAMLERGFRDIAQNLEFAGDSGATNRFQSGQLHRKGLRDHLGFIESNIYAYFRTFDSRRLQRAREELTELRWHIQQLAVAQENGGSDADTDAIIDAAELRRVFAVNVQRIRGYSYLVNVVMAAEAYEMAQFSRQLESRVARTIRDLQLSMQRRQRYAMITLISLAALTIVIASLVFLIVSKSISAPLRAVSATFGKQIGGSAEKPDLEKLHNDEIGILIDASRAFHEEHLRVNQLLASYQNLNATLEKQVMERTNELNEKNRELENLATTDALTGVPNRRALESFLQTELGRCLRYGRAISALVLDLDLFKKINDKHGHEKGDAVLVKFCELVTRDIRESDLFGRWGGEEFLLVCPEAGRGDAIRIADKLRETVRENSVAGVSITVSIGVGLGIQGDTPETLVARADQALYKAKQLGRDRIEILPEEPSAIG